MTGCIALRKDVYYIRLTYYDMNHQRKEKWVSTGLSGRGAKKKAAAMVDSMIEKYSYLEKSDYPSKMADYLWMWKNLRKSEVAETTFDGYHTYIDRHLVPYFKGLNLNIQDITAGHIFDYVNVVAVKESVLADFVFFLLGDFEHRVILFYTKLVFDAVLSNVLFHNHIPFVICFL